MALGKSITFIKKALSDKEFREACYHFANRQDLLLAYDFSEADFEDAINMQLVKCQTYEEAERVQQIKFWFALL